MYRLLDYYKPEKLKNNAHTNERRGAHVSFRVKFDSSWTHTTREKKICAYNVRIHNVDFHFWFFFGRKKRSFLLLILYRVRTQQHSCIPSSTVYFSPERGRKERPRQLNLIMLSYIRRERATATACSCIHTYRCVNALSRLGLFSLFLPP